MINEVNDIVYVGQSVNIDSRIMSHFNDETKIFNRYSYVLCEKQHLTTLESLYIYYFEPVYNKHLPLSEARTVLAANAIIHHDFNKTIVSEEWCRP